MSTSASTRNVRLPSRALAFPVFSAALAANGASMLLAPAWWYAAVPGVAASGPLNPHFVRDIGLVYLALAACFLLALLRPHAAAATTLIAALWLGGHAMLHLGEWLIGHGAGPWHVELGGIHLPALLAILAAWRCRND